MSLDWSDNTLEIDLYKSYSFFYKKKVFCKKKYFSPYAIWRKKFFLSEVKLSFSLDVFFLIISTPV